MVEEIDELAIIFKRIKSDFGTIEEYVPFKVVEGYYYDTEGVFIDTEQNVYSHIASMAEVGNVYGGRRSIARSIQINSNRTISDVKDIIMKVATKYQYFKNTSEDSNEYNIVKTKDKETGEFKLFEDIDTKMFYAIYSELMSGNYLVKTMALVPASNDEKKEEEETSETIGNSYYATPRELITEIKKTIKGQDEAIETIVSLLWMRYKYPDIPKTNMLLLGPSGVGKTAIFKKLKQLLGVPMIIYGITGTSQAGYKGHDLEEMLTQLYYESGMDVEKAQEGIIFIDEFDKISNKGDLGEVGTTAVQNELLKLIEGCDREVSIDSHNSFSIDTTNITFVCCGAFSDLFEVKKDKVVGFNNYQEEPEGTKTITPEMIVNYGIIRELVGRLPVIIKLNDLNKRKDILEDILLNSDESLLVSMLNTLKEENIKVEGLEYVVGSIVDNAALKQIGARGLFGPVRNIFLKVFYEIANNPTVKYDKVVFGENIMNDHHDFRLVKKKAKTRTKKKEVIE